MNTFTTLVSRLGRRVARVLVTGPVPSVILVGVVALAGFSAKTLTTGADSLGPQLARSTATWGPVCGDPNYSIVVPGRTTPLCYSSPNS